MERSPLQSGISGGESLLRLSPVLYPSLFFVRTFPKIAHDFFVAGGLGWPAVTRIQ